MSIRVLFLLCLAVPSWLKSAELKLQTVLDCVKGKYPPYLMALIERDVAAGRLRQAQGAFDLNFLARGSLTPSGYYDGRSGDFVFEQPLPFWGGNVFAGYRVSSGPLADYDKSRTQIDGEVRAGIRLNLLRDGVIDSRRATLWKARLDQELADPFIQRQRIDILRAAIRAYYNWVAMGLRLGVTEELQGIARDRDKGIAELVERGQVAPIIKVDNERLVISRNIAVVQARRRFEAAGIELSLFHRDAKDEPRIPARNELPKNLPQSLLMAEKQLGADIVSAFARRPELRRIALVMDKLGIDKRLAQNALMPHLDLTASVAENLSSGPYKDRDETEASVGIELRIPLQRNEAKGRLQATNAELERLAADAQFARERIVAEVRDAWSAQKAAAEQIGQTSRNVELAWQLEEAENKRFQQGAADLFALQIREQATADARLLEVDARADFFRAFADYQAATGILAEP
ncbi:MAG: TolC family protein [Verrucomicrobiaceae bacterium]|nr:TolC family protein [Verrucomicrobiaceae bacterium]